MLSASRVSSLARLACCRLLTVCLASLLLSVAHLAPVCCSPLPSSPSSPPAVRSIAGCPVQSLSSSYVSTGNCRPGDAVTLTGRGFDAGSARVVVRQESSGSSSAVQARLLSVNSSAVVFAAPDIERGLVGPANYYTVGLMHSGGVRLPQRRKLWMWYAEELLDTTTAYSRSAY